MRRASPQELVIEQTGDGAVVEYAADGTVLGAPGRSIRWWCDQGHERVLWTAPRGGASRCWFCGRAVAVPSVFEAV